MPSIKNVKRTTGDWHVQSESNIHLETQYGTGNNGTVYIWGNLNVVGQTTTIESNDLTIGDKILVLNKNEPGLSGGSQPGVSGDGVSGLSIARGGPETPAKNANMVYDQSSSWTYNSATTNGMFNFFVGTATTGSGEAMGITIAAIRTGSADQNLSLLGLENPDAVISVEGTDNYYLNVTNDDHIPNKKYVDYTIENQPDRRRIQLNYRKPAPGGGTVFVQVPNTYLEFTDVDVPASAVTEPQLKTSIGGNQWMTVYGNRMVIGDIKILDGNEITMDTTNTKLILSTKPGNSATQNPSVELKTSLSLVIDSVYDTPDSESNRVKIYSGNQGPGGTGLYFVNNDDTRDELPSKRRSFVASLMF